jgi:hypothetical protein
MARGRKRYAPLSFRAARNGTTTSAYGTPRLTCKENLRAFGRYHGLSGSKLDEPIAWCLDWAALQDRAGDLAKNLSGGMKRWLNMAAGIIHRPRVVLMDEPTVRVDPQSRINGHERSLGRGGIRNDLSGALPAHRELLVANPVEVVARKIGRSTSSVKHLCSRRGIRVKELRCDLFSINRLAAAMHVRKAEIVVWIDQGWLEATKEGQGRTVAYLISPEALQRCLREHLQDLQNVTAAVQQFRQSSISSATCQSILSENNFSRCAMLSGSRPRTNYQPFSKTEIGNAARSTGPSYRQSKISH